MSFGRIAVVLEEGARTVDTRRKGNIGFAAVESVLVVVSRHDPGATHGVVNVLAERLILAGLALASTDAKLRIRHVVHPLVDLRRSAILAEGGREDETADGVTVTICSVRVELTTRIALCDVELGKVTASRHLDVTVGLDEMRTSHRTVRDQSGAVAGLGAPGDLFAFRVAHLAVGNWSREDAPIVDGVEEDVLAHRVGRGLAPLRALVRAALSLLPSLGQIVQRKISVRCVAARHIGVPGVVSGRADDLGVGIV